MKRTKEYTEFGLWLKMELLKRNLTSRELAAMTGIDFRVISCVMVGRIKSHEEEIREALNRYDEERTA